VPLTLVPATVSAVERERADPMLVARLCDGDADALSAVYDRYASLVHGVARRVLGDEGGAEDVTQDVFTHLWRHPDRVDLERGCLRSYLGEAVVVTVVSSWRATQVVEALERLPEEQQAAVRLAYYGGRTYRQVAAELGIPEGTAKSRLRLALTRLRHELANEGVEAWH
jgi:DNA-directed RNA polymerase specialized sigma24 family protein